MRFGSLLFVGAVVLGVASSAWAGPQLQYVWSCAGNTAGCGGTVVYIHGKGECSTAMGSCNGGDATTGPVAYWTNSNNNSDMLNEATTKYTANGVVYYEAFVIGYDLQNQGFWSSANDVGACLNDLVSGTNNSGCNPSLYQRSQIHLVTHSAGAPVIDRLLSTGWYGINSHVVGNIVTLAPALAGSRAASALYGVDGYSNFCTSLVSWLAGWAFKNAGAASLTRGTMLGEANKGYQGRSPIWLLKVPSTGGSCSANNACNHWYCTCGSNVYEQDNDDSMGALAGCLGYGSSDDMDGLIYWSDADPTNNTSGNGCPSGSMCHYYGQYSGAYWHWFATWANHSHSRDDAYTTQGDWQSTGGCFTRSPGTCVGQYAW
jgi:hypothetical protein